MEENDGGADDDVWDDWEEMEDSGALDERLAKEQQLRSRQLAEDAHDDLNVGSQSHPPSVILQDDTNRTFYQPQLKIMKRPAQRCDTEEINGQIDKQDVTTKTFAEREAAYAEARKRIMGSTTSTADKQSRDEPRQTSSMGMVSKTASCTKTYDETDKKSPLHSKGKR